MAVECNRQVSIQYKGDNLDQTYTFPALTNVESPTENFCINLSTGNTSVVVPYKATSCTIIPPIGNSNPIVIKGSAGDTGIRLHNTDPTTIAIDPSVTQFMLNATILINMVRLVWT